MKTKAKITNFKTRSDPSIPMKTVKRLLEMADNPDAAGRYRLVIVPYRGTTYSVHFDYAISEALVIKGDARQYLKRTP